MSRLRRILFWAVTLCGMLSTPRNAVALGQAAPEQNSALTLASARALAGKGQLDQALAVLATLSKFDPEEPGVERLQGVILYQKEQLPEAEAAFARAVTQDADDRESLEMRGITLYRLGKPAEAIPLLERAHTMAAVKPRSQDRDLGHPADGGRSEVSGANQSVNADPQYVLGLCYTDAKRYDDARRA